MARWPVKKRKPRSVDDDQFFIHPDDVPKGKAYQWVVTHVMGEPAPRFEEQAKASGWKRVSGYKPRGGCVLMWARKTVADTQSEDAKKAAQKQMQEMRDVLRMDTEFGYRQGSITPILDESFMVLSYYSRVDSGAPPVDVDVTVKMRLPGYLQDAASALGLSAETYAQRRLSLFVRGEITGILFPSSGESLELIEDAPFHITRKS